MRSSLKNSLNTSTVSINDEPRPINITDEATPLVSSSSSSSHHKDDIKVSSKLAIWNLFNDILAPGTVALPYYIMQAGMPFGAILLVVFALITMYTLEDIHMMYMKHDKKNYPDLCEHILGKWGYAIVCLSIFCFNFGGLCAQLMLFGEVVPDILTDIFHPHALFTKTNLILMGCVIFLPICFLRDLAKYSFTSFASVSCIFIISFLVFFRVLDKHTGDFIQPPSDAYSFAQPTVFEALGGLAYIYVCHDLSFNVIGSLENPTTKRYSRVVRITMLGTVAFCGLIGISGYLLFFNTVQANILDCFPTTDLVATIARSLLALEVTLAIPFSCFMPRVSIISVLSAVGGRTKKFANSTIGFCCVSVVILGSAVTIAIFVNNLGKLFELVGGVSACCLAFILPPVLILKSTGLKGLTPLRRVITVGVLVCGLFIMIGSTLDIFDYYLFDFWHEVRHVF